MSPQLTLAELVVEMRKCAESDEEFARIVALARVTIIERNDNAGEAPGDVIRRRFELK